MKSRKLAGRRVNEKRKSISDQRRDASMRHRGVSAISASTSLKEKGPKIEGDGKTYGGGHEKHSSNNPD